MEQEIWKDIAGYEGLYQISSLGRVKSLERKCRKWDGIRQVRERILKPSICRGYYQVKLRKNNKVKTDKVHRLVAQAFLANPDNLPQVNHKDENKTNNRVDNLEWCTNKYNINYGTTQERRAEHRSKQVLCIETATTYKSASEACRRTGILTGCITACCRGERLHGMAGKMHWVYVN